MAVPKQAVAKAPGLLQIGMLVHLVSGGRTLENYEVLDMDDRFVKFRANAQVAPQTEVILIPFEKIEVMGLPGER
jgi:hypothetical protein